MHKCTTTGISVLDNTVSRREVAFPVQDGAMLRGWLYTPKAKSDLVEGLPAIVMTGGFATTKEMYTDRYAEKFSASGFAVLLFDARNFGSSDGGQRGDINPLTQVQDFSDAITFMTMQPEVDISRVGVWGSSYSGGEVLVVAASDKRVRCVVAQVPTVNGSASSLRRMNGADLKVMQSRFSEERIRLAQGKPATLIPLFGSPGSGAVYPTVEASQWYTAAYKLAPKSAKPEVTLLSTERSRCFNPGDFIDLIGPVPLLMILAENDDVAPIDLSLRAFNNALEPKFCQLVEGAGHFDVYTPPFYDFVSNSALQWFLKYLGGDIQNPEKC